jgi:DNA-binding transcriptional LysR family regulator
MLKINLKQLEAFVATAEFSSFTKASEELFLTQSTVSSHVSALESALGIRLIQRSARQRVMLTKEGEQVYREAKEILERCQALQDLKNQSQEDKLVIGASSVPGQCLLPEIMGDFLEVSPDCHYVQLRGDSAKIHQYLAQGKANLGFVGIATNPREYHYHSVAEDRLVLITANKEPYQTLHRSGTSGLDLLTMPMILREENSGTRQEMERYLLRNQISPEDLNVIAQIDNPEAIRSSVSRGLGVSIMSVLAAREYLLSERLLSFELGDQGAFRKIYLCWRKDALLTPAEQKFLDFVQQRALVTACE